MVLAVCAGFSMGGCLALYANRSIAGLAGTFTIGIATALCVILSIVICRKLSALALQAVHSKRKTFDVDQLGLAH